MFQYLKKHSKHVMTQSKRDFSKYYDKINELSLKITKGNVTDAKDLVQDVFVIILEYDTTKMNTIIDNGHLIFWTARVMMNQYVRSNSTFKSKYYTRLRSENFDIKNFESFDDIDWHKERENKIDFIDNKLQDLHEYDKLLFQVYYSSGKSIRTLAKETNISTTSIYTTLKNVKNYLKDEAENEYKELER